MGGFPLQLLNYLVFCINDYSTMVLSLLIKHLFMLCNISDPNRHAPSGINFLFPSILLRDVALSLWPSAFLKQASSLFRPNICIHN